MEKNKFKKSLLHSSEVEEPSANAGDLGSIPGTGRSPEEGNGNPLQYSYLGNPMGRGVSWLQSMRSQETDRTQWLNNSNFIKEQKVKS